MEKLFIYLMMFSLFVILIAGIFVCYVFIRISIDRILGGREEDYGLIIGMSMTEDKTDDPVQDTNQPMSRKSRRMKNNY